MSAAIAEHVVEQCHCEACALDRHDSMSAILAGPHVKSLVEGLIIIEPLAFVPVRHATDTDPHAYSPPAWREAGSTAPTVGPNISGASR